MYAEKRSDKRWGTRRRQSVAWDWLGRGFRPGEIFMSRRTVRFARVGGIFVLLLSLLLGVAGRPSAVGAQTSSTSNTGVSGSTYTSPSFGYSIEWDRSWDVSDEK